MREYQDKSSAMTAALRDKSARMKELSELIRFAGEFKRLKPVYEEWNGIKFQKTREKFKTEHESELRLFLLAKHKLDAAEAERLKPIRDEFKELYRIKSKLSPFLRDAAQDKNNETRKENHAQEKETH